MTLRVMADRTQCHQMSVRNRVMGGVARTNTERYHNACSRATFFRWKKRQREEGNYEPRAQGAWARGCDFLLSGDGAMSLFWIATQYPQGVCCSRVRRRRHKIV
jgi:hypothetical protein